MDHYPAAMAPVRWLRVAAENGSIQRRRQSEYKAKRKRLQAALDAGSLTQKEFDQYDADLLGCLQ